MGSPAHRVVIVGGGFGGLYAAQSLRNAPVQVTLVDRRNFHLFQPLLYQVATASLSPANIASPLRYILKKQSNAKVYLSEVAGIDLKTRTVRAKDGELHYDSLIVAAGAENNYFGHPEWAAFAPGLKTLEDATDIRRRILLAFESAEKEPDRDKQNAWLSFVIVGAGPTGVELAGSLAEIARDTLRHEFRNIETGHAKILLIDGTDRVLTTYPSELSTKAERALTRLGVTFQGRSMVIGIQADRVILQSEGREEIIPSRTVLWAAGVQGSPLSRILAEGAGIPLQKGGRIAVSPDLSLPGYPEVYVIGDMAYVQQDGQLLPGTAPVAMQEGRYAAKRITARLSGKILPAFRYWHKGDMATIGRAAGVADFGRLRFNGFLAWMSWLVVHLWFIVEFENRLLVFLQWAWNYFTHNRDARLITGDTPKS
jgi:NADH:ubiquinone reductase (H+-translocating)